MTTLTYQLIADTADGPVVVMDCGTFQPVFDPVRRCWLVAAGDSPTYLTDGGAEGALMRVQTTAA